MNSVKKTTRYYPWNPGFEAYGTNSRTYSIYPDNPIADLVCQIYEIDGCAENQSFLSAIPDGCHDIILACGPEKIKGYFSVSVDAPRRFHFEKGTLLLGIRFLPGAPIALHRESVASFLNTPIPLEDIFPKSHFPSEELFHAPTPGKREEILTRFLQKQRLEVSGQQRLLHYCTDRIIRTHGKCSVEQLSQDTGYSRRYIHNLFKKYIGNAPKLFEKTIRMQHAASLINNQKQLSLSEIAAECGYADQSHMYRDFMQLTCHSPKQIRENGIIELKQNHIKITHFK
ncbi:helix-turn-helix domain-containing protein [Anaerotignum sp.]